MRIDRHPRMDQRTTLRLGGTALAQVTVEDPQELEQLPEVLARLGGRPLPLGRGSNLLARDGQLDLVLVSLEHAGEPVVLGKEGGRTRVEVTAGCGLPRLLGWCAGQGLAGLEPLSGIPGSVGGAAAMNAGSYGLSFCERLASVRLWGPQCGLVRLSSAEWNAGYRSFSPQVADPWWCIVSVEVVLEEGQEGNIRASMRQTFDHKKSTQPILAASAGCVFKNPTLEPAGRLLDLAGFKGRTLGGVGFSAQHANFLVNHGQGTAAQALELIATARNAVRQQFDVELEMEVQVVG